MKSDSRKAIVIEEPLKEDDKLKNLFNLVEK